jgi:hypothetical protein
LTYRFDEKEGRPIFAFFRSTSPRLSNFFLQSKIILMV